MSKTRRGTPSFGRKNAKPAAPFSERRARRKPVSFVLSNGIEIHHIRDGANRRAAESLALNDGRRHKGFVGKQSFSYLPTYCGPSGSLNSFSPSLRQKGPGTPLRRGRDLFQNCLHNFIYINLIVQALSSAAAAAPGRVVSCPTRSSTLRPSAPSANSRSSASRRGR